MKKSVYFRAAAAVFVGVAAFVAVAWYKMTDVTPAAAVNPACSATAVAQNGIKVVPSHNSVFYIDSGVSPKLDAGYIGYQVQNLTGATQDQLWAQVESLSGGVLSLNDPLDAREQLPTLANNETGTSYFLLKASGPTVVPQTHTLKVYNKRPDVSGATALYQCDFTFSAVKETIRAVSNRVTNNGLNTSAAIEVSDTSPELGQLVTISVEGQTGQIGAGSAPDFDIIWFTPAGVSSWPTRALRLEDVSITFDGNGNWASTADQVTYRDQLFIPHADGLLNVDNSQYRAYYTFRVIGRPAAHVSVVPIAQIASGTQIKHSDTGLAGTTLDLTFAALSVSGSLSKSVTADTGLTKVTCGATCEVPGGTNGVTYVAVPYRMTGETASATTLIIDEIVDEPDAAIIFKPGSARITDLDRVNVAIPDPVTSVDEASRNPRPMHFIGPFSMNAGQKAILDYTAWVPVGSYSNIGYLTIGDFTVGTTTSTVTKVTVTSDGSGTITSHVDTEQIGVIVVTEPATDITASTAILHGTVDPNGTANLTATFKYGTDPNLAGATTVTATSPASGDVSGLLDPTGVSVPLSNLSSGTRYYYRVVAGTVEGDIHTFSTLQVFGTPTVTVAPATSVTTTSATLLGAVNPNSTNVTGVQFIYGTTAALLGGTTTVTVDDGTGNPLTLSGATNQNVSQGVTGLTGGTTYYYKVRACTSALLGAYPTVTCTAYVESSVQSFLAATVPAVSTQNASSVITTSATLNGSATANGAITSTAFVYGRNANLSDGTTIAAQTVTGLTATSITFALGGLAPKTTYYFRATATNSYGSVEGDILSFTTAETLGLSRTLTVDPASYSASYALLATPPTIVATPSAGGGTITYSSLMPTVCTVNESTGLVTFVAAGTCTITSSITLDETYAAASSDPISFEITLNSRTLSIDGSSYSASYTRLDTPPTLTATPSAGTGTITFTSATPARLQCE